MLRRFLPLAPTLGVAGAIVAGLTGCSSSESPVPAKVRDAIIGGELSPPGIEDAVLFMRTVVPDAGERLCGASLVADNLVVTARHCVAYVTEGPFLCTPTGELVEGTPGAGRMGLDLPAENLEFYTNELPRSEPVALGASIVSTLSDSACSSDLAFVVLDRHLDLPVLPLRRGRPALEGETVIAVGYGADRAIDQMLDFETQRRRRRADLQIAAVGPDSSETVGSVPPRIVIVDGPSACLGDSGGPLLAQATNALLAVHSLVEGNCVGADARSWYTHLPPLGYWIDRAFEAAGTTPTLEPEPPGDPCADGGCGGAGGAATSGAGGDATGGVAAGAGGAPSDPTQPEPEPSATSARSKGRDAGCELRAARDRSSSTTSALMLLLVALFGRARAATRKMES